MRVVRTITTDYELWETTKAKNENMSALITELLRNAQEYQDKDTDKETQIKVLNAKLAAIQAERDKLKKEKEKKAKEFDWKKSMPEGPEW